MSALLRTTQITTRLLRANTLSQSIILRSLSTYPTDRKYKSSHEWAKLDGNIATIGITDHAQAALGDIVFADLPDVGDDASGGERAATVESVKAAADIYAPFDGEVVNINTDLKETPQLINSNPHEDGWIFQIKMSDPSQLDTLMSSEEYEKSIVKEES